MPKVAIVGTTGWGITLGFLLTGKKTKVSVWARTAKEAAEVRKHPESITAEKFKLPPNLSFTASVKDALNGANGVIIAVPSQSVRQNVKLFKEYLSPDILIINAAKGFEIDSKKRMSEVIAEEVHPANRSHICVLSGPNLAREIIKGLPASSVIAAHDTTIAKQAQELLSTPTFTVYTNTDVIGVELGGSLKNVIALGAGMVDGLKLGDNAKAAFITRGLTEMAALGVALGANPLTLSGLTGLGDLIATCASPLSRNHYVGFELTKGRSLKDITKSMKGVAEGITTTAAVYSLAQEHKLGMPISEKIYQILYEGKDPKETVFEILGAGGKHELSGRKWRLFSFKQR